jgi:hypothetical protein
MGRPHDPLALKRMRGDAQETEMLCTLDRSGRLSERDRSPVRLPWPSRSPCNALAHAGRARPPDAPRFGREVPQCPLTGLLETPVPESLPRFPPLSVSPCRRSCLNTPLPYAERTPPSEAMPASEATARHPLQMRPELDDLNEIITAACAAKPTHGFGREDAASGQGGVPERSPYGDWV